MKLYLFTFLLIFSFQLNAQKLKFKIEKGLRIAQMILCPVIKAVLKEVDELKETERGSGGFGSTGVK